MTLGAALIVAAQAAAPASSAPSGAVVFPFVVEPSSGAWLGHYVADELPRILALAGLRAVQRIDRVAAREAFDLAGGPVSQATAIRLAEVLGADRIVIGTARLGSDTVGLEARLLDPRRGSLSAPITARGPYDSLTDVVFALAWDVALAGPSAPGTSKAALAASRQRWNVAVLRSYGEALASNDAATKRRHLDEALAAAPDFDVARIDLARLRLDGREYEAALRELEPVASGSPVRREADFLKAAALLGLGRFGEGHELLLALSGDKPSAAILANRGLALLRSAPGPSGTPRASDLLRQANEAMPGSSEITFNLAYALLHEGEHEAAIFWLQGLRERDPDDTLGRVVLSWALRQANRSEEADAEWNAVITKAPSFEGMRAPDTTRRLERILLSESPFMLDPARRSDKPLAAGHRDRGEQALASADLDTAFRELSRAAYLDPYEPEIHRALARLHLRRGEKENAASELRMSLWCADNVEVREALMSLLVELGRGAEAAVEARRILKSHPENAAARKLVPGGSL